VVLAIGGMALTIIFSIGTKAGDTGFGLGRRAMAASDTDVAASDLRTVIRSIALRPVGTFVPGLDEATLGSATKLETDVVMERATQCAQEGWAGRMKLTILPRGTGSQLLCEAAGRSVVLIETATASAFSYSADGEVWDNNYTNGRAAAADFTLPRSETVWVRFASGSELEIIEAASSGRPETWSRVDVQ
jgi:hypothetical protein